MYELVQWQYNVSVIPFYHVFVPRQLYVSNPLSVNCILRLLCIVLMKLFNRSRLFGLPLLIAVKQKGCTYDTLYNCILDRMALVILFFLFHFFQDWLNVT